MSDIVFSIFYIEFMINGQSAPKIAYDKENLDVIQKIRARYLALACSRPNCRNGGGFLLPFGYWDIWLQPFSTCTNFDKLWQRVPYL